jgi:Leucine-rich repeat (LRR) protein
MFDHQRDLKTLNLSNNTISTIGTSVFTTRLFNLHRVDLSNNKLTAMEAWPYIPPKIVTFNVSNNYINRFTNHLNWTYDLAEPK